MSAPVSVLAPGLTLAGAPGLGKVTANTRVKTLTGPVGVIADVVQAPGLIGTWVLGATQVSVMGVPAITQMSVGVATTVLGVPAGPMVVALGDAHVGGSEMATAPLHALRFSFGIDVGAGRAAEEGDYEAYVRQLIRQVLLTAPGERINRPDFGAGLRRMVFAPISNGVASLAQTYVYQSLTQWLASVIKVEDIQVSAVQSTLYVDVRYTVIQRGDTRVLREEVSF